MILNPVQRLFLIVLTLLVISCNQDLPLTNNKTLKKQDAYLENIVVLTKNGKDVLTKNIVRLKRHSLNNWGMYSIDESIFNDSLDVFKGKYGSFTDSTNIRYSQNGQYILTYNFYTNINTLYSKDFEKYGEIELKANNPEFSIETVPLENEPGILLIDLIYGIKKYTLQEGKFKQDFEINLIGKNNNQVFLLKNKNEVLVTYFNDKTKTNHRVIYDLNTASIVSSIKLGTSYKASKYFYDNNIVTYFGKDILIEGKQGYNKDIISLPLKALPADITIGRGGPDLHGLVVSKNDINHFKTTDGISKIVNYQLNPRLRRSSLHTEGDNSGFMYFETNTPGKFTNDTKILRQGFIVFRIKGSGVGFNILNVEFPKNEELYKVEMKRNFLSIKSNNNHFIYRY